MNFFISESDIDDSLLRQIYRPIRQLYSLQDLGPQQSQIQQYLVIRQDFVVNNSQNQKLQCSIFAPSNILFDTIVIYMHGNAGSRLEAIPLLQYLIPEKIALCCFDFSGCGRSQGDFITLGIKEIEDLDAVIQSLFKLYKSQYRNIILWGRSMGAVVALSYCSSLPSKKIEVQRALRLIVSDSAFSSFKKLANDFATNKFNISSLFIGTALSLIKKKLQKKLSGYDMFTLEPWKKVQTCNIPAIFAYSFNDSIVSSKHSEKIMKHYAGKKLVVTFNGDHNSFRDKEYHSDIISKIKKILNRNQTKHAQPSTSMNLINNSSKISNKCIGVQHQMYNLHDQKQNQQLHHVRSQQTTQLSQKIGQIKNQFPLQHIIVQNHQISNQNMHVQTEDPLIPSKQLKELVPLKQIFVQQLQCPSRILMQHRNQRILTQHCTSTADSLNNYSTQGKLNNKQNNLSTTLTLTPNHLKLKKGIKLCSDKTFSPPNYMEKSFIGQNIINTLPSNQQGIETPFYIIQQQHSNIGYNQQKCTKKMQFNNLQTQNIPCAQYSSKIFF